MSATSSCRASPPDSSALLALLTFWVLRTRWQDRSTLTALPVGSAEAAGAILAFLVAAAGLLVWANLETAQRGQGAGAAAQHRHRGDVCCGLLRHPALPLGEGARGLIRPFLDDMRPETSAPRMVNSESTPTGLPRRPS